jgi:DNA-binding NtrC family response regulator
VVTAIDSPPTVERGLAQNVLVVDDDASIRLLCRINLELEGWTVREAESLTDARRELAEQGVAVVLLDVHVGLESGVQFLDEIKRDRPGLPVAMLTGSVDRSTIADLPAEAVIAKPFTLEQLSDTVRVLAEGGRVESPPS